MSSSKNKHLTAKTYSRVCSSSWRLLSLLYSSISICTLITNIQPVVYWCFENMLYFIVLKNRPRLAYPVLNWPFFFFVKKKLCNKSKSFKDNITRYISWPRDYLWIIKSNKWNYCKPIFICIQKICARFAKANSSPIYLVRN